MQYPATHLVVMGVAGSGKSTIAAALSQQLGWSCAEADEFHPQSNIDQMHPVIPLQAHDRRPWLRVIGAWSTASAAAGTGPVLPCPPPTRPRPWPSQSRCCPPAGSLQRPPRRS